MLVTMHITVAPKRIGHLFEFITKNGIDILLDIFLNEDKIKLDTSEWVGRTISQ